MCGINFRKKEYFSAKEGLLMNLMHNAFFGEVLWRFRKRKRLSQQRLAGYIGVHRDSISSWERGEYFPETPTTLHELARVLMLDAARTPAGDRSDQTLVTRT